MFVSKRIENDEKRMNMGPAAGSAESRLGQNGEPSKDSRAADDKEMRGIVAFFGPIRRVPEQTGQRTRGTQADDIECCP